MSRATARAAEPIEVVAGVLRDGEGRVLLSQRAQGKHLAGTWEFPGGKLEPAESPHAALSRELAEELGIEVESARPWLSLTHHYSELSVRLRFFEVDAWGGTPCGREGQSLHWAGADDLAALPMPAADRPVIRALDLDGRYALSPEPREMDGEADWLRWADAAIESGIRLVGVRASDLPPARLRKLAGSLRRRFRESGVRWLLDGEPELAGALGADGVHLSREALRGLSGRPVGDEEWAAASCRDQRDLELAGAHDLDFAVLSPLRAQPGRSDAGALGWAGFTRLCADSPLPVFAGGGVGFDELAEVRERGGFGVAVSPAQGRRS